MAKKPPAKKSVQPVKKAPAKAVVTKAIMASTPIKKSLVKAPKEEPRKAAQPVASKSKVKVAPVKVISKPAPKAKVNAIAKPLVKAIAPKPASSQKAAVASAPISKPKTKSQSTSSKITASKIPATSSSSSDRVLAQQFVRKPKPNSQAHMTPFLVRQRQRLLELKDTLLDSMRGVARDNLHAGTETSAFGMHQADAGSDAYDRDFALSMLSKEQGSLYEIDEALKRIDDGTYGVCDICEKPIRHDRLEALPFTRYTVECQAELEKRQHHHSVRPHINSLFGLTEEETESEEEESADNS